MDYEQETNFEDEVDYYWVVPLRNQFLKREWTQDITVLHGLATSP